LTRRPLVTFSVTVISLTWLVQFAFLAVGWPLFPALVVELVFLVSTATVITGMTSGRPGVRSLYAQIARWRIGVAWYAVILLLLPVATLVVAAVGGTLSAPADGAEAEFVQYLFLTVVFGALLGNVWEELAWTGFLQSRLTRRHGLLKGALLTAMPFGLIHLPLAFESGGLTGTALDEVLITWILLLVIAPFFRYLVGMVYLRTGRSVLAVAILHGSFNAAGAVSMATGGWEYIVGLVAVTPLVALVAARRPGVTSPSARTSHGEGVSQ
jgi:membrane protease YdiL (CAAX protease family)